MLFKHCVPAGQLDLLQSCDLKEFYIRKGFHDNSDIIPEVALMNRYNI